MIKQKIIDFAHKLGIEKIGFTENSVVALFPYFVAGEEGNLSLYARCVDYHTVAEKKLTELSSVLLKNGATKISVHADRGNFNDRKAAFDAGLGFYGQNGMLICEDYGSYFFIGQIIHDLEIKPDEPQECDCLMCGRCERECPGKALKGGRVDIEKCLSHITQKRGELAEAEKALINEQGMCWGCDVCQRVCPHNRGLGTNAIPEFLTDRLTSLSLLDVQGLSNREFKEKYGNYAFSWRGKGVLIRNLKVCEKYNEEE